MTEAPHVSTCLRFAVLTWVFPAVSVVCRMPYVDVTIVKPN